MYTAINYYLCHDVITISNSWSVIVFIDSPTSSLVQITSEQFGRDYVTVILEWPNGGGGVSYSASVTPESLLAPEVFSANGGSGIKLVLFYNTRYNLSIVATLCEVNSISITELNYGELLLNFDLYKATPNWLPVSRIRWVPFCEIQQKK